MKLDIVDGLSLILVNKKLINPKDLESIHKEFKHQDDLSFEDFLLDQAIVTKEDLLQALSEYYQVPSIDVTAEFFEYHNIRLVPKDVMIRHYFIPLYRINDELTVVAANPNDPHLRVLIGRYFNHQINFMVGLAQDIINAIMQYYEKPITYQPNDIENQQMERSQIDVNPISEDRLRQENKTSDIPEQWEQTVDDYEK